jgi:hypothetical protein
MLAMISQLWPIRLYLTFGWSFSRNSARSTVFHGSSAGGCQPVDQLLYPWRTTPAAWSFSKSASETALMAVPPLFRSLTPLPNWITRSWLI